MTDINSTLPVIAQSIYYIKKFQDEEKPLPNVVFAGDKNECFIIGTAALLPYLSKPYDWSIAPSTAYKHLPLMADLIKDENIIPVVFSLDSEFSFTQSDCVFKIPLYNINGNHITVIILFRYLNIGSLMFSTIQKWMLKMYSIHF